MILQFGEIVLIRMQFHQTTGAKIRPALVLLDTGDDDFVAAPITSQLRRSDYDLAINDWRAAGLNVPSYALSPQTDCSGEGRCCA
jgi:mRNA interferase MazF